MNLLDLARSALQVPAAEVSLHRYWRVEDSNGVATEVLLSPPAGAGAVRQIYPAARIEPIAEPPQEVRKPVDRDIARRRNSALAILADNAERRIAVVAEAGNPTYLTVAVRDIGVGDVEIPADKYDALALLKLMEAYA